MLVDSFSVTHDETAASVDSQAQLLVEAGWRLPRPRQQDVKPCTGPLSCGMAHDEPEDDELFFEAQRERY